MLNANNEINVKKEERKHSWSTVFAWLYLKTIGGILPKRWNRWAENILYYDKTTANNEVQTDAFKTVDESVQVDLKPEVVEKESQSVVISKGGGVQTDGVALCIEKVGKSVEVNLKSEVAEKDGEITSEGEEIYSEVSGGPTDEDCSDIEVDRELTDDNHHDIEEIYIEDDELQTITLNKSVPEESEQLKLQLAEYEEDYTELKNVSDQIEKELSVELEEKKNEVEENLVEMRKKDEKISSLTRLNKALEQNIKKIKTENNEQQQIAEIYMKSNELLSNVIEISEKTLQLHNQEQQEEKRSLENKILELRKQAQTLEGSKENVQKKFTDVSNQKGVELEKSKKNAKTLETALSNQKKEWEADSNKKAKEIENLKGSKRKLEKNLQEKNKELVKQKELAEQATKEVTKLTSKIKNSLDEVNKLQKERRNMEEQLKIMQQRLSDNQEQQNEKTKKSQEQIKIQRKPLQDKNLEHFLSDRNMGLKKDFPEFKEKNFFLNFLRETVKLVSNKQDDKFQGRKLLNLFKSNLKELAKKIIENRVKEVVINKGNKYFQVSKNIDKELLDGTIRRDKLKDELSHSVEQCMKKLELDVKDATTITNSIIDKLCNKENNNKSPALREIVVRDLTEARMKIFLEKVKEINLVPNNVPNSFMSHTNNTKHVLSLGNVRTGS